MRLPFRAAIVFIGSVWIGGALGSILDKLGMTPSYDGDGLGAGLQVGVGLGFILIGFVCDREPPS